MLFQKSEKQEILMVWNYGWMVLAKTYFEQYPVLKEWIYSPFSYKITSCPLSITILKQLNLMEPHYKQYSILVIRSCKAHALSSQHIRHILKHQLGSTWESVHFWGLFIRFAKQNAFCWNINMLSLHNYIIHQICGYILFLEDICSQCNHSMYQVLLVRNPFNVFHFHKCLNFI